MQQGLASPVIHLFDELWKAGHTLVLITHDPSIAERTKRVVQMQDGRIVEDVRR